jgi:MYXO-CTERM domain-containing protein
VGYSDGNPGPSPNATQSTMLYQGVMDCVAGTFQWQSGAKTLPASFYLSGKPAFWGSEPWPAIGPDVSGGDFADWANSTASTTKGHVNKIPALNCFNTVTSNGTTNVTTFDANECYATSSTPGMDGGLRDAGDGGTVGSGDSGTAGKDGGGVGPDGSPGNGASPGGSNSGCGCRAAGVPPTGLRCALALAFGLGLLAAARRRRRETSR